MDEWILLKDAARLLETTPGTLLSRIYRGTMRAARLPAAPQRHSRYSLHWHVLRSDVDDEVASRQYEPLSPTDAAWLAGFIDGEGCIVIFRTERNGHACYAMSLRVVSTDQGPLEWLRERVGGFLPTPRRIREEWRMVHQWCASPNVAERVLRDVLPYLRIKHRQAVLAIQFQERVRESDHDRFHPVTTEELDWRNEQRKAISLLNQRKTPDS